MISIPGTEEKQGEKRIWYFNKIKSTEALNCIALLEWHVLHFTVGAWRNAVTDQAGNGQLWPDHRALLQNQDMTWWRQKDRNPTEEQGVLRWQELHLRERGQAVGKKQIMGRWHELDPGRGNEERTQAWCEASLCKAHTPGTDPTFSPGI